jgi:hypothetical protein
MQTSQLVSVTSGHKWLSSPVTSYRGPLDQIEKYIPSFERRTFGPELLPSEKFGDDNLFLKPLPPGFNRNYDVIVRKPLLSDEAEVPVGIVSKQYSLIQHRSLFEEAIKAVKIAQIKPEEIKAELEITEYGERMRLGLTFPEQYNMKVKDDVMGLRLECFNSVEGSMKFISVIGWLRFVCSNGLIVGVADTYYKSRHNRFMELSDIAAILKGGIEATTNEKKLFQKWQRRAVSDDKFKKWTDNYLVKKWGVKAAVRTWHITRSGLDVEIADPFEKGTPTEKTVIQGNRVPGAILPGDNVYAVSQSLSWLAKERRDVQEQLEWKQQIPELLAPLCK